MKRRISAALLTMCLLMSLMPSVAFAAPGGSFDDVDGHWGQAAVERWAGYGVVNGDQDGNFNPNNQMTRAEFATMLANMLGYKDKADNSFTDVSDSDWYADAVLKLAAAGVIQGSNGMANPNAAISRQESAVMMCRAFNIPTSGGSLDFADSGDVADWAKGAVAALAERGMMNGVGENNVAPLADINRASVATLLNNMITEYVTEDTEITGEVTGIVLVAGDAVVTVKDATLAENLIVAPKADGAEVTLTGSTTAGDVFVGASATVKVDSDATAGAVQVAAANSTVEVAGKADAVTVESGADNTAVNVAEGAAVGDVAVNAADSKVDVAQNATVETVAVAGANADVTVSGKVESVTVAPSATGTGITANSGATVGSVETAANDVTVSGNGTVENVTATGGTASVTTPGTTVENQTGSADNVTNNGQPVEPSTGGGDDTTPTPPPSSGGSTGGSSGGNGSSGGDTGTTTKAYTITYELNGGTNPDNAPDGFDVGDTITLPTPTKAGYTFDGWYEDAEFTTRVTDITTSGDDLANVTLYAKWTANTYTITLNANGGTNGSTVSVSATYDQVVTGLPAADALDGTIPTKENYTFKGWSLTPDGAVATEIKNLTADANGTATLYAVWALDEDAYELKFVFVDATTGDEITGVTAATNTYPQAGKKDTDLSLSSGAITVVGYTVTDGLFTAEKDGQAITTISANTVNDSSYTVYVRLTEKEYTITYDLNTSVNSEASDGITKPSDATIKYSKSVELATLDGTTHYTFKGWATSADASAEDVLSGTTAKVSDLLGKTDTDTITLYAIWEGKPVTVTFTGEDVTESTQNVKYNETVIMPQEPTRDGYTFDGWYNGENKLEASTKITEEITFTAKWTPATYTVKLEAGEGAIANGQNVTSYTFGTKVELPGSNDVTRENYTFAGWYANEEYTGEPITEISATDFGNKTFYAKWESTTTPGTDEQEKGENVVSAIPNGDAMSIAFFAICQAIG